MPALARCLRYGKQRSICAVPGCELTRGRALSPALAALEPAVAMREAPCGGTARVWPNGASDRGASARALLSPAATRARASRASTAMPAGTSTCSPTRARRATSARAATRSACCCTDNGSSRMCSRLWRTGSTCSRCPNSCARSSAGTGRGWANCAASPRGVRVPGQGAGDH
jgi:hypothetical protein